MSIPRRHADPPTLSRQRGRIESGHYAVDVPSVHDDESSARGPWDDLVTCPAGRAELKAPDRPPVVRPLPLESLEDTVTVALGQWYGDECIRHWFALRRLPVEQGRVNWRLDRHLELLGEPPQSGARERATVELDRITKLVLTVLTPRLDMRLRAPLYSPIARTERAMDGHWVLRDMIIRVHPLLVSDDDPPTERDDRADRADDTLNERNTRTLSR